MALDRSSNPITPLNDGRTSGERGKRREGGPKGEQSPTGPRGDSGVTSSTCGFAERSPKSPAADPAEHADEHRPQRPVLLAVDKQLGEGAALRIGPELSDPVGSLEVGEHEDVEQFGAGSRSESIQTLPQSAFDSDLLTLGF